MTTTNPSVKIGEVLEVPFPHPCDRQELRESKKSFELRNYTRNFPDRISTKTKRTLQIVNLTYGVGSLI
jgi:nitrate/nitrite transport system ATP-binding protein